MIMFRITHEAIVRKLEAQLSQVQDTLRWVKIDRDNVHQECNEAHQERDTAVQLLQAALILLGTVDTKRSGGAALRERIAMLRQEAQAHGWLEEEEYYVSEGVQMQKREETA